MSEVKTMNIKITNIVLSEKCPKEEIERGILHDIRALLERRIEDGTITEYPTVFSYTEANR